MTLDDKPEVERRPGIGKGKFTFDDELFDELDAEIADMFEASMREANDEIFAGYAHSDLVREGR